MLKINDKGTPIERLLSKIVKSPTGCWLFTGKPNNSGYGSFWLYPNKIGAHRASWIIHFGPIPDKLNVCHKCDTPICVNPQHLFLGTDSQNMRDCATKGRSKHLGQSLKTHCKSGHIFDEANTHYSNNRKHRSCRMCHKLAERRRKSALF
jgi:hypothetical protein